MSLTITATDTGCMAILGTEKYVEAQEANLATSV